MQFLIGWCIIFSLIGFCSMGIDKRKAQLGKWRIPERTLFLKTRHASFRYGLPLIFVLELIAVLFLYRLRFTA